jgi:hypothetical protein
MLNYKLYSTSHSEIELRKRSSFFTVVFDGIFLFCVIQDSAFCLLLHAFYSSVEPPLLVV